MKSTPSAIARKVRQNDSATPDPCTDWECPADCLALVQGRAHMQLDGYLYLCYSRREMQGDIIAGSRPGPTIIWSAPSARTPNHSLGFNTGRASSR